MPDGFESNIEMIVLVLKMQKRAWPLPDSLLVDPKSDSRKEIRNA